VERTIILQEEAPLNEAQALSEVKDMTAKIGEKADVPIEESWQETSVQKESIFARFAASKVCTYKHIVFTVIVTVT
jgi:hypothetical protein